MIDLYVVVQYGTRISEVAHGVMNSVDTAWSRCSASRVSEVNVHVQGLRMLSDTD